MAERDFKGIWIPAEVWLDERLNPLEKVILVEIDSLDCGDKGCYASNEHIAEFCKCSESKVAHAVSRLVELGYVSRKSFDGRQRILQSRLANFARRNSKFCKADMQDLHSYNIKSNIDSNIDSNIKKERSASAQTENYDSIIDSETENEQLRETYREFVKMRKLKKAPMTNHALKLLIGKVNKLSRGNEQYAKDLLDEAIINGWKSVYPPKNYNTGGSINSNAPRSGDVFLDYLDEQLEIEQGK